MRHSRTRAKRASVQLSLLVGALTLGGLLAYSANRSAAAAPVAVAAPSGTLVFARSSDILGFDPVANVEQTSISTQLQVFDRLVEVSQDGKRLVPGLATAWKVSKDGLSVTFTLRQGVRFSDGSSLTAADVVFSLTRAINPKAVLGALFGKAVKSVAAVDATHVRVSLSKPFSPLVSSLSIAYASIYSKSNFQKQGKLAFAHPLGTGAYQLQSWTKGSDVVLTPNPYYWGSPKPTIGKIIFRDVSDPSARVLQLQSGAADIIDNVPPSQVSSLQQGGSHLDQVFGPSIQLVWLNEKYKPFADANVRLALAYSLDRLAIAKRAYFGFARPATSGFPSGTFFHDGRGAVSFSMSKAKAALAKSAYPKGFSFQIIVQSGGSPQATLSQIWAASLKSLGIKLTIVPLEQATAFSKWNSTAYQASLTPVWVNDTPDASEYATFLLFADNGDRISWTDKAAAALAQHAQSTSNASQRQKDYSGLQQILNTQEPLPYVVDIPVLYANSPKVVGFAPNPSGRYFFERVSLK